jgi:hypothetical protein
MECLTRPDSHRAVRWLDGAPREFREQFNRTSFAVAHYLADHPLFRLPRLVELAKRLSSRTGEIYFDVGEVGVGQRWDEVPPTALSVEEALERIEACGVWIIIRRAELDPDYRVILEECIAEVQELTGRDLRREMKVQNAIIFITSPHRVSAYHIDRECNFILQIHGDKTIHIFDQNDRELLREEELERFWVADNNAARYRAEYQDRARTFLLAPGTGVHVPVNAPHWLQNGDNISVTLSINFQFHDHLVGDIYRANYYLRRAGLKPAPPGVSPTGDAIKKAAYRGLSPLRNLGRVIRPGAACR